MLPAGTLAVFAAGAAAYVAYVAQLVLHAELTTPLAAALKVMPIVALAVGVATANGALSQPLSFRLSSHSASPPGKAKAARARIAAKGGPWGRTTRPLRPVAPG